MGSTMGSTLQCEATNSHDNAGDNGSVHIFNRLITGVNVPPVHMHTLYQAPSILVFLHNILIYAWHFAHAQDLRTHIRCSHAKSNQVTHYKAPPPHHHTHTVLRFEHWAHLGFRLSMQDQSPPSAPAS